MFRLDLVAARLRIVALNTRATFFFDPACAAIRWQLSCLSERMQPVGAPLAPQMPLKTIHAIFYEAAAAVPRTNHAAFALSGF